MGRKVKSVSFNLDDPFESEMLEHSKKYSNFSVYVKRLIQNALEQNVKTPMNLDSKSSLIIPIESSPIIDERYMRQLI